MCPCCLTAIKDRPDGDLNLELFKEKLIQEFQRRLETEEKQEESVLKTGSKYKKQRRCYNCGSTSHLKWKCPQLKDNQKANNVFEAEIDSQNYQMDHCYGNFSIMNRRSLLRRHSEVTPDLQMLTDRLEKINWFKVECNFRLKTEVLKCCICNSTEYNKNNLMIICFVCHIQVHQVCYGIPYIPKGPWLCRKCLLSPYDPVSCVLCPNRCGAFKKTDKGLWVHVVCALYFPEVRFGNNSYFEPVIGIENINLLKLHAKCYMCKQDKIGACVPCHKSGCTNKFHASCAQMSGLLSKSDFDQNANAKPFTDFSLIEGERNKRVLSCLFHTSAPFNGNKPNSSVDKPHLNMTVGKPKRMCKFLHGKDVKCNKTLKQSHEIGNKDLNVDMKKTKKICDLLYKHRLLKVKLQTIKSKILIYKLFPTNISPVNRCGKESDQNLSNIALEHLKMHNASGNNSSAVEHNYTAKNWYTIFENSTNDSSSAFTDSIESVVKKYAELTNRKSCHRENCSGTSRKMNSEHFDQEGTTDEDDEINVDSTLAVDDFDTSLDSFKKDVKKLSHDEIKTKLNALKSLAELILDKNKQKIRLDLISEILSATKSEKSGIEDSSYSDYTSKNPKTKILEEDSDSKVTVRSIHNFPNKNVEICSQQIETQKIKCEITTEENINLVSTNISNELDMDKIKAECHNEAHVSKYSSKNSNTSFINTEINPNVIKNNLKQSKNISKNETQGIYKQMKLNECKSFLMKKCHQSLTEVPQASQGIVKSLESANNKNGAVKECFPDTVQNENSEMYTEFTDYDDLNSSEDEQKIEEASLSSDNER